MFPKFLQYLWTEHKSYYFLCFSAFLNVALLAFLYVQPTPQVPSAEQAKIVQVLQQEVRQKALEVEQLSATKMQQAQLFKAQQDLIAQQATVIANVQAQLSKATELIDQQKEMLVDYKQTIDSYNSQHADSETTLKTRMASNQQPEETSYEMAFNLPLPTSIDGVYH